MWLLARTNHLLAVIKHTALNSFSP